MLRLSGYQVSEELGGDELRVIRRALREADGLRVLIKAPRAATPGARLLAVLRREHELLRSSAIVGVPEVLDFDARTGTMVLTDGGGELLSQKLSLGRLPLEIALEVAIGLARIVGELHRRRIVIKNLAPQGILFDSAGNCVQIVDLVLASRLAQETRSGTELAQVFQPWLPYLSPEQTGRMNRAVDYRSDFYSLGAILYQMLTGKRPFWSEDPLEIVHWHIARLPPSPSELEPLVPETVSSVVMRMLHKSAQRLE